MLDADKGNLAGSGDDRRAPAADAPRFNVNDEEAEDLARYRECKRDLWAIMNEPAE